ncbi:uncharacterized protein EAF01_005709 [Botrytis porri]|uniref:uncharacterized protein n=1 Tax=Botrytis porri TaxID=87229 RepID=UPI0019000802|nr:uncharacterized protein EAF01_005709 [Botrytis porri]KAF7905188.1 hypothetical protein EAF01_005709 [Botrytis porri]
MKFRDYSKDRTSLDSKASTIQYDVDQDKLKSLSHEGIMPAGSHSPGNDNYADLNCDEALI